LKGEIEVGLDKRIAVARLEIMEFLSEHGEPPYPSTKISLFASHIHKVCSKYGLSPKISSCDVSNENKVYVYEDFVIDLVERSR
jgi:hypothetical protein